MQGAVESYKANLCPRVPRQLVQGCLDSICSNLHPSIKPHSITPRTLLFHTIFIYSIYVQGNRGPLLKCTAISKTLVRRQTLSHEQPSWSIPHVTAIFTFTIPDFTAGNETSIRKKYTGGIGGRTIYSVEATNSTLPLESSGLSSASRRRPFSSKGLKYSTGTETEYMVHSRRSTRKQTVHIRQDLSTPAALSTRDAKHSTNLSHPKPLLLPSTPLRNDTLHG
jgi:hypothetical protein